MEYPNLDLNPISSPDRDPNAIFQESMKESLVQFTCEDGQYSPSASILFTTGQDQG